MGKSNLVTAPSGAKVRKYELTINSKVNDGEVIVDSKSNELQADIQRVYNNLASLYFAIAQNYKDCATKSVKGDNICSALKKVAKNCENQGKACQNRCKQLVNLYRYDAIEKNVDALEDMIGSEYILKGNLKY